MLSSNCHRLKVLTEQLSLCKTLKNSGGHFGKAQLWGEKTSYYGWRDENVFTNKHLNVDALNVDAAL